MKIKPDTYLENLTVGKHIRLKDSGKVEVTIARENQPALLVGPSEDEVEVERLRYHI
ncbi:hypothetical protein KGY79_05120 [Candidatus Bipolaricaulota bacterium]|nr:hypothetical protein [Candidatus Bipolaricaulota bacterium]